ncbi:MAG: hypothetical protein A2X23_00135 [Chloroflexi bacterium GWC2_73_18]|nr:MAG: hypothetical protein A2X23_00135 [Chloroflexi bacterium GWC2_73_18]
MSARASGRRRVGPILKPVGDIRPLVGYGMALQAMASQLGIHNVFDDNGYKDMLLLTMFGLTKLGREGDDAVDARGRRYETKTVARVSSKGERKASLSITTEHTMTLANIARYRSSFLWIIAVFDQAQPEAVWEISPALLEPYFSEWELKLREQDAGGRPVRDHLNNPKIPLKFIAEHGTRVWPPEEAD